MVIMTSYTNAYKPQEGFDVTILRIMHHKQGCNRFFLITTSEYWFWLIQLIKIRAVVSVINVNFEVSQ